MTTYSLTLNLRPGPPVLFNDAPLPPYLLAVNDGIVFELDSGSYGQGWRLQGYSFTASAWWTSGLPILIGGAFQSIEGATLTVIARRYMLPVDSVPESQRPAVTLQYTTGSAATGVGFIYTDAYNMDDVILSLGLTITVKSPTGEIYSSHDPQVVLGPRR